jgi:hypothetical protein
VAVAVRWNGGKTVERAAKNDKDETRIGVRIREQQARHGDAGSGEREGV